MFSKLKRILYPENMLFKMIILNCGLLLLVTLVLTAAGNYIYEESIAERSYANTMEIQNQVLKSLDLIFKSVEDNVEALGNYPEVQEYLKVDAENQQASRVELERQVRDLLLDYSRIYSEYLNIVVVSEKGQYLSNDSYRVKKLPLTEEKWYQDMFEVCKTIMKSYGVRNRTLASGCGSGKWRTGFKSYQSGTKFKSLEKLQYRQLCQHS